MEARRQSPRNAVIPGILSMDEYNSLMTEVVSETIRKVEKFIVEKCRIQLNPLTKENVEKVKGFI